MGPGLGSGSVSSLEVLGNEKGDGSAHTVMFGGVSLGNLILELPLLTGGGGSAASFSQHVSTLVPFHSSLGNTFPELPLSAAGLPLPCSPVVKSRTQACGYFFVSIDDTETVS